MLLSVFHVVELLVILEGAASINSNGAVIIWSSSNPTESNYILKNVDEALELTCVQSEDGSNKTISWDLPENILKRVLYSNGVNGSITVSIGRLVENDSGEYKCGVHQDDIHDQPCTHNSQCYGNKNTSYASVHVYVKKKSCLGFQCSPNVCISQRYVCDGQPDCKNNEDESSLTCGPDPCKNKIVCPNGRCIPQEWCCINVKNCTRKWDVNCCPIALRDKTDNMKYLGSPDHFRDQLFQSYETGSVHHSLETTVLQIQIHTVISCALVFVVIGPILVLAGCKLYTRQRISRRATRSTSPGITSTLVNRSSPLPTVSYRLALPNEVSSSEELRALAECPWFGETPVEDSGDFRFNQPQAPPPYSEVMLSHHIGDPPPPYMPSTTTDEDSPSKDDA